MPPTGGGGGGAAVAEASAMRAKLAEASGEVGGAKWS